jgi:hypothetical protein
MINPLTTEEVITVAVTVMYGANNIPGDYVGFTVQDVRRELSANTAAATELNIPQEKIMNAVAFLNGGPSQMTDGQEKEYRLRDGDKLEFSKEFTKGKVACAC